MNKWILRICHLEAGMCNDVLGDLDMNCLEGGSSKREEDVFS